MSFKSQSGRVLALVVSCLLAVTAVAVAQMTAGSRGVAASRIVVGAYSSQDTVIGDGTLVQLDTLTAAQGKGIAVKPYTGGAAERIKVVGIAYGSIPKRGQGAGQVLIFGIHNNAKVGSSTLVLNAAVRPGLLYGKLSAGGDSISMACGVAVGFSPANAAGNPRAQVYFTGVPSLEATQ